MKNIDIIAIIIIIIIIIAVLFSDCSDTKYEHFRIKTPSIKKIGGAIASVAKKAGGAVASTAKKADGAIKSTARAAGSAIRSTAAKRTPARKAGAVVAVSSSALLNKISNIKTQETLILRSVDSVNKMSITVNNLLNILSRRIPQIPNRIKFANQKRIFTLYLIRKTQTKIAYLNSLIIFTSNINSGKSTNTSKEVNILVKKINLVVFAIKTYISRTQSYICQTTSIFFELEETYNNIFDLLNELKIIGTRFNSLVAETRKNVETINKQFEAINLEIQEANKPPPEESPTESSETAAGDSASADTSGADTSADTPPDTSADAGGDVEGFNNATLFEPIVFEQTEILIPETLVLPAKNSLPKLDPKELITPTLNNKNLIEIDKLKSIKLAAASNNSSEVSSDTQMESYILSSIPLEPIVDIPADADQADINAENDLVYELS